VLNISGCTLCELHKNRTQVVEGEGPKTAPIMIVGECPGPDEDKAGRPFIGRAGALLRDVLDSIGVDVSNVYITNIVKCFPFHSLNPSIGHIQTCSPFLGMQIEAISPKLIVSLGRISSEFILNRKIKITLCSGQLVADGYTTRDGGTIPVLPVLHPSFVLRGNMSPGAYSLYFLPMLGFQDEA